MTGNFSPSKQFLILGKVSYDFGLYCLKLSARALIVAHTKHNVIHRKKPDARDNFSVKVDVKSGWWQFAYNPIQHSTSLLKLTKHIYYVERVIRASLANPSLSVLIRHIRVTE